MEIKLPTTVSASRVPAMLGMDSRCSPLTLYLRMRGELGDEPDNEAMLQGRFYERATAEIACHKYGMKLVEGFEQKTLTCGPLSGHPDFLAIDEHGKLVILEVKNPFFSYLGDGWGEPGSDEVPTAYFIQSLTYCHLFREWWAASHTEAARLLVDGKFDAIAEGSPYPREAADYVYVIARLHGGVERFKVPFDRDIVSKVEKDAAVFLHRVRNEDPPDPQDEQDMRNRWAVTEGKVAEVGLDFVEHVRNLKAVKEQIKALQAQETALKTVILGAAQDAEKMEFVDHGTGERRLLLTLGVNRKLDEPALLADHPELLNDFAKLDVTAAKKVNKGLFESYMRKPEKATEQTRVIRIKLKEDS